jgi:hypothetical protein
MLGLYWCSWGGFSDVWLWGVAGERGGKSRVMEKEDMW